MTDHNKKLKRGEVVYCLAVIVTTVGLLISFFLAAQTSPDPQWWWAMRFTWFALVALSFIGIAMELAYWRYPIPDEIAACILLPAVLWLLLALINLREGP